MSEPIRKAGKNPESYSPKKPEIVNMMDEAQNAKQNEFTRYESFEYRFDVVEFPENIKVAGVPNYYGGLADGEYIGEYETKYESIMRNAEYVYEPYTYTDVWSSVLGIKREHSWTSGNRIYGCLVKSLDNLPEGIVGAEIGVKKFLVMTVRGNSWEDFDKVANHPVDNFRELVPNEFKDAIYPPIQDVNWHFQIDGIDGNETFYMSYIESITPDCGAVKEKKFYAPMKY